MLNYLFGRKLFEHETRFAKLHEKRAEVIAEMYRLLVRAERSSSVMVNPLEFPGGPSKHDQAQAALGDAREFWDYFQECRLYVPEVVCTDLEKFGKVLRDVYQDFRRSQGDIPEPMRDIDGWSRALDKLNQEVVPAKRSIETAFRKMLGDTPSITSLG
ncbi:MAG: hypothetical protein ACUVXG_02735 [Anaerolineae bacterium]